METEDDQVNHVLAQLLRRTDNGETIDHDSVIAQYPQFTTELRAFFEMERLIASAAARLPTAQLPDLVLDGIRPPSGYSIVRLLGRGGMGVVYGAVQGQMGRRVALKVLPPALTADPARVARFRQEAIAASRLTSSHVLPVFDVLEHNSCLFIVTPWIDGVDMSQLIRQRQTKECDKFIGQRHPLCDADGESFLRTALRICDQIIEAVVAIHDAGILHRDIKPSNVLIDARGDAWLGDFGLAKFVGEVGVTVTGDVLGTLGYMSPEQLRNATRADFRSDVFSLGVTIYELLTGRLPYGPQQIDETSLPAKPPSRFQRLLSKDYDAVLLRAMDPRQANRYASAHDFQDDWNKVRQGLTPVARRPNALYTTRRWISRRRWLIATSSLGVSTIGLAIISIPKRRILLDVEVPTKPEAARGAMVPLNPDTGNYESHQLMVADKQSEGSLYFHDVAPGDYYVVVQVEGHGFHEVFRHVPDEGETSVSFRHRYWTKLGRRKVRLHEIIVPGGAVFDGMIRFAGSKQFRAGLPHPALAAISPHEVCVPPFYLDPTEVSLEECLKVAMNRLLPRGTLPKSPVTDISFDQALEFAELLGKRLPTEFEYEFAATNGGNTTYPWGDDSTVISIDAFGPTNGSDKDLTQGKRPAYHLFSGVAEWTSSWGIPYPTAPREVRDIFRQQPDYRQLRIARGGPIKAPRSATEGLAPEIAFGPRYRISVFRSSTFPWLGFRCAKSASPPFLNV